MAEEPPSLMKKTVSLSSQESEAGKKKYEVPRLVSYGTVTNLTRGGGGHGADSTGHPHTKACWIAEVLYGIDAPRTHLVRAWLTECYERREPWSLIVVPLYSRFGQPIASFLRSYPAFKSLFRPLFDLGVRRAHRDRVATLLTIATTPTPSV
jgi:hypothetical protein